MKRRVHAKFQQEDKACGFRAPRSFCFHGKWDVSGADGKEPDQVVTLQKDFSM